MTYRPLSNAVEDAEPRARHYRNVAGYDNRDWQKARHDAARIEVDGDFGRAMAIYDNRAHDSVRECRKRVAFVGPSERERLKHRRAMRLQRSGARRRERNGF